ncbi:MAG TPA: sulfotransferase [Candidatus Acidoferrales bacterium]|nr:sulfotransferase [Candidatus Acidoferrales bacterium]
MKQRSSPPLRRPPEPAVRWQGKLLGLSAACALAVEEHRRGSYAAALELYNLILNQAPNYAEGHNNRGVILQALKRYAEALASYDGAIALKPGYANAHFNRGTVLKKLTRREEALASYDRAIALQPDHVEAHNNRGVVLQEMKRYDEALASYDRAIALNPAHAEAHNNRGIVLASKGQMAGAEAMFLRASELKPGFADPWFNLANIRNYQEADNPELRNICSLLDQPGITPEEKEHLHFSLGKIYDDCGRYEEAFAHFREANQLRNTQVSYNPVLVEKMTARLVEVFDQDFLTHPFEFASTSRSPLFVVGMPRSGTTLLASMLSNHPAIAAAGELPTLGDLLADLPQFVPGGLAYPEAARQLTAAAAEHVATGYEQRLRRDVDASVAFVIDKNPLNFRHVGLISRLFPQARIIHCTRQAPATCLSNYFQRFPLHLDFSFELRNIGHFYREYAKLMEHWRRVPNVKLMEVAYEDMILNTERTARRLLEFLGLEFDVRCLAPHTNRFPVETASHWQVRQPIYQDSLEHWRHYEKHLGPLREMLPGVF